MRTKTMENSPTSCWLCKSVYVDATSLDTVDVDVPASAVIGITAGPPPTLVPLEPELELGLEPEVVPEAAEEEVAALVSVSASPVRPRGSGMAVREREEKEVELEVEAGVETDVEDNVCFRAGKEEME